MSALLRAYCFFSGLVLFLCSMESVYGAIGPGNVLVLYNNDSPQGIELANYYAQVHPGVHLLGLSGVTTDEQITDDYYLNVIRPQILPALNSSIDTIVTTKGLPLRIYTDNPNPGTYVDPSGITRTVTADRWKPYSSLESELTRISTISTWQQMGDQYFSDPRMNNPSLNPYYPNFPVDNYKTIGSFDTSLYGGMRLTARLDGFTTADVEASINKAQNAYVIPNSRWIILDDDPNSVGGDRMPQVVSALTNKSYTAYKYENTDTAYTTAPGPVIGYVSHGVNDGAGGLEPGYIAGQLQFQLANGSIFFTHESYNAYSFKPGGNMSGQGLVAEWLAIGGTAGIGNVQEPLSGKNYEANEDQMYKMLLSGYTWGEAAWSSITQLSYVTTVVGDPLMTWKQVLPGDANLDGRVDVADLSLLGAYWGTTGSSGGSMWGKGDFNADGVVDVADLSLLGAYWGQVSSWAGGGAQTAGPLDMEAFLQSVPEPSIVVLILTGIATSAVICRRHAKPDIRLVQF